MRTQHRVAAAFVGRSVPRDRLAHLAKRLAQGSAFKRTQRTCKLRGLRRAAHWALIPYAPHAQHTPCRLMCAAMCAAHFVIKIERLEPHTRETPRATASQGSHLTSLERSPRPTRGVSLRPQRYCSMGRCGAVPLALVFLRSRAWAARPRHARSMLSLSLSHTHTNTKGDRGEEGVWHPTIPPPPPPLAIRLALRRSRQTR